MLNACVSETMVLHVRVETHALNMSCSMPGDSSTVHIGSMPQAPQMKTLPNRSIAQHPPMVAEAYATRIHTLNDSSTCQSTREHRCACAALPCTSGRLREHVSIAARCSKSPAHQPPWMVAATSIDATHVNTFLTGRIAHEIVRGVSA